MTSKDLQQQGALFHKKALATRRRMCCQNAKQCFLIGFSSSCRSYHCVFRVYSQARDECHQQR